MTSPSSVGLKDLPSRVTYSRLVIVVIVAAYVDGRPMPFSSSVLISDASVKRAGGCVKCWFALELAHLERHARPRVSAGPCPFFLLDVAALFVKHRVAVEADVVAGGLENVIAGGDHGLRRVEHAVRHLAGDEALPDQLIQLVLVLRQRRFDVLRRQRDGCRADRLMAVLRVLARLEVARFAGR